MPLTTEPADAVSLTAENQAPVLDLGPDVASETTPFAGIDLGVLSTPALADLDDDGDQGLVVGASNGTLRAYVQTGSGFAAFATDPLRRPERGRPLERPSLLLQQGQLR